MLSPVIRAVAKRVLGARGVEVARRLRARLEQRRGQKHPVLLIPASRDFGFDRGNPVDRYYIEDFLARHTREWLGPSDVRGRVLEVGEDRYAQRFGNRSRAAEDGGLESVDIVDVNPLNEKATIVGDLAAPTTLPADRFDCVICTQTLMCIYDVRAAIANLHRSLRQEGVLLMTVAGISRTLRPEIERDGDFWRFTSLSVRRLLEEFFPADAIKVQTYGNVRAATAFLYGLAAEELSPAELDLHDKDYEVIVAARAVKRSGS
jgi:SAM-dependent methyltransferase